jgi:hypothetical protein
MAKDKKILRFVVGIIIPVFFYSFSLAQPKNKNVIKYDLIKKSSSTENVEFKKEHKMDKKERKYYQGIVENVDLDKKILSVKGLEEKRDFIIKDDVKIWLEGSIISLDRVGPGDKIKISYEGPISNPIVKAVKIKKSGKVYLENKAGKNKKRL